MVVTLFLPSLVGLSTELMTECFATLLTALMFDFILANPALSKWSTTVFLGLIVGLETLLRFNMAILGPVAVTALAMQLDWSQAWRRICLITAVAALVVAPWIVRNLVVFRGDVVLSTQSGINAVRGVLAPQGRGQGNDVVHAVAGWASSDLESNGPSAYITQPEPELDQRAWAAAFELWREQGWRLVPLSLRKLGYFWLSTDQVFWTQSFSMTNRVLRLIGAMTDLFVSRAGHCGMAAPTSRQIPNRCFPIRLCCASLVSTLAVYHDLPLPCAVSRHFAGDVGGRCFSAREASRC